MGGAICGKDQQFTVGHAECYFDVEQVVEWVDVEIRRFHGQIVFKTSRLDSITNCRQRIDWLSFGLLQHGAFCETRKGQ